MKKKFYIKPNIKFVILDSSDIIACSNDSQMKTFMLDDGEEGYGDELG